MNHETIESAVEAHIELVRKGRVAAFPLAEGGEAGIGVAAEVSAALRRMIKPEALCRAIDEVVARAHRESAGVILLLNPGAMPLTPSGEPVRGACRDGWRDRSLDTFAIYERGKLLARDAAPAAAATTPTEERLAALWREVLRVRRVQADDSFFGAGGDSLKAAQLLSRLDEAFGVRMEMRGLFEAPSLRALAARVDELRQRGARAEQSTIARARRDARMPLSFAEQRLWFLWQMEPDSPAYNIAGSARLAGDLDVEALRRTFEALVARHETLRTRFPQDDGQPYRAIDEAHPVELPVVDLSATPGSEADREERARLVAQEEACAPFDLARGPVLRVRLVKLAGRDHRLLVTMHHIVSDGWSMNVMMDEIGTLYEAYSRGLEPALPALTIDYADYAVWQRAWLSRGEIARQLEYWKQQLGAEQPVLELPTSRPRPATPSYSAGTSDFEVGEALTRQLSQIARENGATLFMVCLAAFKVLLYRYSGQRDVRVGVPVANRNRVEIERLIGFFVNTQVLRTALDGNPSFRELLGRVKEAALGAEANQDLPFERLVDALRPERRLTHSPLFQVMFSWRPEVGAERHAISGLEVIPAPPTDAVAKFDLTLHLTETRAGLRGSFVYRADLFDPRLVAGMQEGLLLLLRELGGKIDRPVAALDWVEERERARVVAGFNRTGAPYPQRGVHAWIHAHAVSSPEAMAVRFEDSALSYAELERRASQLARWLRAQGVAPEGRVGLYVGRSLDFVVGLYAVLKCGAAYVPLDPKLPGARLRGMVEDSGAQLVLGRSEARDALSQLGARPVFLDDPEILATPGDAIGASVHPDSAAYVIYTSGSTGRPKGVVVTHRGVSNYVQGVLDRMSLPEGASLAMVSTVAADLGNTVLFGALCSGRSLHLISEDRALDPDAMAEYMHAHGVHALKIAPSHLAGLLQAAQPARVLPRHTLIVGGEATSWELVSEVQRLGACRLLNHYGPTETTVGVLTHLHAPEGPRPATVALPLGKPLPNSQVYILNRDLQPMPVGVPGEIFIGGEGVARGYLNRPDLTAERFIPDPYGEPGARLYRTGDQARYLEDGTIEFLGRIDEQIKLRGYRIELGEIRAELRAAPGVSDAHVLVNGGQAGNARLVAYVIAAGEGRDSEALRAWLSARLPDYMVPSDYVWMDSFPVTANGKLDRKALPEPVRAEAAALVLPRTEVEEKLAAVWREALKLERVGVHDNFFALGGDSILTLQVVARARKVGISLTPKQLFAHQTIAEAARVAEVASEGAAAAREEASGEVELTPGQRRFLAQGAAEGRGAAQAILLELAAPIDVDQIESALQHLAAHHDALRLRFRQEGGAWKQWIAEGASPRFTWRVALGGERDLDAAAQRAAEEAAQGLDLEHGPLLRAAYMDPGDGRPVRLLLAIHRLVVDGDSWRILLGDLQTACAQLRAGGPVALPAKGTALKRWARLASEQAEGPALERELAYWQRTAGEIDASQPGETEDRGRGGEAATALLVELPAEQTAQLLSAAVNDAYRTQPRELLLVALSRALCDGAGRESLLLELEGHGRGALGDGVDAARTVGWLAARCPVRLTPAAGDLGRSIKAVKEQLRAVPRGGVGYEALLGSDRAELAFARAARPQVSFTLAAGWDQALEGGGAFRFVRELFGDERDARDDLGAPGADITVTAGVDEGRLRIRLGFRAGVCAEERARDIAARCAQHLSALIAHCLDERAGGVTPSDFPLARMTQEELDALPAAPRDIEDIFPLSPMQQGMLLHTLLEPGSGIYVMQDHYRIDSAIDPELFVAAWRQVVARHPALRASFVWQHEEKMVQIVHRRAPSAVEYLDWTGTPEEEQQRRLDEMMAEERRSGFDLARAPLLRLRLFRLGEGRFLFVKSRHHILIDAWCRSLMLVDFFKIYRALSTGTDAALSTPPLYRDFIAWLVGQDRERTQQYWRDELAGFEAATPLSIDRPLTKESPVSGVVDAALYLSEAETEALGRAAQRHQLTMNTIAQGAWAVLLSQYGGSSDVLFGVTVAGRPAEIPDIQETVGLFINTIPLRVRVPARERTAVARWLRDLQDKNASLRHHEQLPLVDIQACSEVPRGLPLFHSLFVFENAPLDHSLSAWGAEFRVDFGSHRTHTNYPITAVAIPGKRMKLLLSYDERMFAAEDIERMLGQFRRLLLAMAERPEGSVQELPLLGSEELAEQERWNRTERAYPLDRGHVGLFEEQVRSHPERVAARCLGRSVSYGELNEQAARVGRALSAAGVKAGDVVAVFAERGLELLAMILGVFKAGAAYVPLDSKHPAERTARLMKLSVARAVVVSEGCEELLREAEQRLEREQRPAVLVFEALQGLGEPLSEEALWRGAPVHPEQLAYVIYTSGSTGTPKGAMVTSAGMLNNQLSKIPYLGLTERDVIAQTASQSFDISVWQFLAALLCGARVEIVPDEVAHDPVALLKHVNETGITILESVPSLIQGMLGEATVELPRLRRMLPTGEAMAPELARQWLRRYPEIPLVNAYGPAECADDVTLHTVEEAPGEDVVFLPIGRPTDNNRLYVVNSAMQRVPVGVVGELCVAGVGVGRGYLGDPERTAEAFVPNPFSDVAGERLYRTGDLGRYRADGLIECVGRLDHQVKIRGFRIELGEIEARLLEQPGVKEAVVLAREDVPGQKRLVAYVVLERIDGGAHTGDDPRRAWEALRSQLGEALPEYMVPQVYVLLEQLPLSANGKVDRRALPAPDLSQAQREYVAPSTALEQKLAEIWSKSLRVAQVGLYDNFFELGGDSIIALQVVGRAKSVGIGILPRDVFQHQTLSALAGVARWIEATVIDQGDAEGEAPLTPIQRWFFEQEFAEPHHWNQSVLLEVREPLDIEVLEAALQHLARHHDALRLRYRREGGQWRQWYSQGPQPRLTSRVDLSSEADASAGIERAANAAQQSLNLAHGPLVRAVYMSREGGASGRLLLVIHHLVVDGVSWRILLEDLQTVYRQLRKGESAALPAKSSSFKRWSEELQKLAASEQLGSEIEHWKRTLDGVASQLPANDPEADNTVASARTLRVELSEAETQALLTRAPQAYRAQASDLLLTALAHALCAWSGQESLLVNLGGHGREDLFEGVDVSRTVGWFTTQYPVRLTPAGEDLGRSIKAVKEQLRAVPSKGIGHGVLRYLKGAGEALVAPERPRVAFNYLGQFDSSRDANQLFALAKEQSGDDRARSSTRDSWFDVNTAVHGDRLQINWRFCEDLHTEGQVRQLLERFVEQLHRLIEHCLDERSGGVTPSDFPLATLTQEELDAMPVPARNIEDIYPLSPMQQGMLVHTLLESGSGIYLMQEHFRFDSAMDPEVFLAAWEAVVERHPTLRTSFVWQTEGKMLQIVNRRVPSPVEYLDWGHMTAEEQQQSLEQLIQEELQRGFDLARAPLLKLRLIRFHDKCFYFVKSYHHILIDGWCSSLLLVEFFARYQAMIEGGEPRLSSPPSYRDFIAWLGAQDRAAALRYWRETLAGFESPTPLAIDRPIPKGAGTSRVAEIVVYLSDAETELLGRAAQRQQITVNTIAQGAWAVLLSQYGGSSDVLFGVTVAGRPAEIEDIQDTVGLFINTIPLRVEVPGPSDDVTVSGWLKQLLAQNVVIRQYEYMPLVDVQACSELPRGKRLFHSLLVFENAPLDHSLMKRKYEFHADLSSHRTHTNYPITVVAIPGKRMKLFLSYDERMFAAEDIERMLGHLRRLLLAMAERPEAKLRELPLLGAEEAAEQERWNRTERAYPLDRGHVGLFEEQVQKHPERVAARCLGRSVSYGELNEQAARVGRALSAAGVKAGDVVAVFAERGLELLAMILGVFKAGAAYVPLDSKHPAERTARLMKLSVARAVVVSEGCEELLREAEQRLEREQRPAVLVFEAVQRQGEPLSEEALWRGAAVHPEQLAYVIYTSGSTGTPKGAMVTSAGMLNNQLSKVPYLGLTERDVIAQTASQSFDISVWQFLAALLCGARVEIVPDEVAHDPVALLKHVNETGITILESVPSLIQGMLGEAPVELPRLRRMLPTGEAMAPELARQWLRRYPQIPLVNAYGPAECADDVTLHTVEEAPGEDVVFLPIGRPTDNNRLYVVNSAMQRVPVGVVGELCVAGVGVGRGYLGDPERTAEAFVPNPFSDVAGERLYRTGDLGRYRADGLIECVGRVDHQVKIRGFRIELGEIEARLLEQPGVKEAAVLAREDVPGQKRLVAYVALDHAAAGAPAGDDARRAWEALRAQLEQVLPEYMVPQVYVLLEQLPLSANGKVDRRALPAPDLSQAQREYVAPSTALEQKLAEIWSRTLHVEQVGLYDNFFELGGDSIIALQVVGRAKSAGIGILPRDVFQHQTLSTLAGVARWIEATVIDQGDAEGEAPLTPIQRWFFEQEFAEPHHWNQSVLLEVTEPLDVDLLEAALQHLARHHDALRLRYRREGGQWHQGYSQGPEPRLTSRVDLSNEADASAAMLRAANAAQQSLSIEHGPLARAVYMTSGDGTTGHLLLVIHHLVVDGVSWRILLEDLQTVYQQLRKGESAALPAKSSSFKRWAEELQELAASEQLASELGYWQQTLDGGAPVLPARDPAGDNTVASARTLRLELSEAETQALLTRAPQAYRAQASDLLLTALTHTLCAWSGQESLLVGLTGHGREDLFEGLDVSRTAGWFTAQYPVRLTPAPEDLGRSIKAVKEQLRAVPGKGVGYGVLRYLSEHGERLRGAAAPLVAFNYLGQFDDLFDAQSLWRPVQDSYGNDAAGASKRDAWLDVNAGVHGGRLQIGFRFSEGLHAEDEIRRLMQRFVEQLHRLIEHCLDEHSGGVTPSDFPLAKLTQQELDAMPVPARNIEDIFPLSPMQQGMLLHTLLEPGSGIYLMQELYHFDTPIDPVAFVSAWEAVVERHPTLRTSFVWQSEGKMLQIVNRRVPSPVEYLDWGHMTAEEQQQRLKELVQGELGRGFDLTRAPLLGLRLIRLADRSFYFVESYHHILIDGWCSSLLLVEFFARYRALVAGERAELTTPPPYRDFIAWLGRQDKERMLRYWREALAGFEAATPLAIDRPIPKDAGTSRVEELVVYLSEAETEALGRAAQRQQITVNTIAQGAWAVLLSQYSGSNDVLFGVTVAGRPAEIENIQDTVGLFINSIPLRVEVPGPSDDVRVSPWLKQLLAQNVVIRQHEHVPLVDIQACSELPRGKRLFHSLLVFENAPLDSSLMKRRYELQAELTSQRTHTNYPLTVVLTPGSQLELRFSYDERMFAGADIERMLGQFRRLLLTMAERPEVGVRELPLLGPEEAAEQERWNLTERAYPLESGYVGLFEEQVRSHPERVAARCLGKSATYGELNEQAARVGRALSAAGVKAGDVVAVFAERGLSLLAMILGVFKAGAAYVPLDSKHPAERTAQLMKLSAARAVVVSEGCRGQLSEAEQRLEREQRPAVLVFEALQGPGEPLSEEALWRGAAVHPEQLAYVIYTSGSTGTPKGAMVTSAGMLNNQLSKVPYLGLTEQDVIAQTASQSFDISVWQFLAALLCGARVEIVPDEVAHDPVALLKHVNETGITILESVPSLIQGMLGEAPVELPRLRRMLPTGEAMAPELARQWLRRYPEIPLVNAYGPAECADDVTLHTVEEAPGEDVVFLPIGRPTDNNRLYVVNQAMQRVPVGVIGELCVAGVGVGRGYLGDPERTAEAFVPNPFSDVAGERLYRTGDLARYRADGVLECVGRVDHQVKIRGYRVELGEIEARLLEQPGVKEAAVLAREDVPGQKRLVAYVALEQAEAGSPEGDDPRRAWEALRSQLGEALPEYMVPQVYVLLEQLPLSANGKVDRRALPAPDVSQAQREYVAPSTALEQKLAEIWGRTLRVEKVGLHDNFFELGGDSILALQVVGRAKSAGLGILPRDVFQHQTLSALAGVARWIEATVIDQGDAEGEVELTPIQRWFFEQELAEPHHWNQSVLLEVTEPLDLELLEAALQHLARHHDALRLRCRREAGTWKQWYSQGPEPRLTSRVDLRREADTSAAIERAANAAQRSLDLERGPLLRGVLMSTGAGERLLLLCHHLAADGVSWRILLEDLQAVYRQLRAGQAAELPPKTTSFKRWSQLLHDHAKGELARRELAFWQRTAEKGQPDLPATNPGGANTVAHGRTVSVLLSEAETSQLLTRANEAYQTQINDLLLTALALTLCAWSGHESALIELEGHGREDLFEGVDTTRTVGWFTILYPARLTPARGDLGRSIGSIKRQLRELPNKGIGYGVLRYLGEEGRALAGGAQPRVQFNYLGQFDQTFDERGFLRVAPEPYGDERSPTSVEDTWFGVSGHVLRGRMQLSWRYSADIHTEAEARHLLHTYVEHVREIIKHCLKGA
ncbi:non-ribosomal peptide synthase/polyketide synthase [Sorangium sp. So ce1182]|uniref:non-ribosomal peptide synthase/polyketide synthase n=1 Tax=Sorangium sp. So ce1182 TaxID=3133334 RepID=UPI003F5F6878